MSGPSDHACPFCLPASDKIFHAGSLLLGLWDQFPVNKGHALLVPKRHVETWFDATPAEQRELVAGIDIAREVIEQQYQPDGYNFGVNVGSAAGQTVFHLHLHVIPRYSGDMADPRGGIRHVVPARGNYTTSADYEGLVRDQELIGAEDQAPQSTGVFSRPIVTGGDDHLLVHLRQHFLEAASVDLRGNLGDVAAFFALWVESPRLDRGGAMNRENWAQIGESTGPALAGPGQGDVQKGLPGGRSDNTRLPDVFSSSISRGEKYISRK